MDYKPNNGIGDGGHVQEGRPMRSEADVTIGYCRHCKINMVLFAGRWTGIYGGHTEDVDPLDGHTHEVHR